MELPSKEIEDENDDEDEDDWGRKQAGKDARGQDTIVVRSEQRAQIALWTADALEVCNS